MKDNIGAAHHRTELVETANVVGVNLHVSGDTVQILQVSGEQVIDHDNTVSALLQKAANEGRADEPRAARNYEFTHKI